MVDKPWAGLFVFFVTLAELAFYDDAFYAYEEICDEFYDNFFVVNLNKELVTHY